MKIKSFVALASALLVSVSSAFAGAEVGKAAPAFTLKDTSGNDVLLSDQKGKIVVLEWINYDCPFVKKHYDKGHMQKLQSYYAGQKNVTWLSIHSAHKGHGTYQEPAALQARAEKMESYPSSILLDPKGTAGKAFGAKTTPHMFIINKEGVLVYAGGIDSIKSTSPSDIEKAEPLFKNALEEVLADKTVTKASTPPYGCSVKYAN